MKMFLLALLCTTIVCASARDDAEAKGDHYNPCHSTTPTPPPTRPTTPADKK